MKWHDVIVSLASNMNQRENLQEARRRLQQILSDISYSQELWTEPVSTSVSNEGHSVSEEADCSAHHHLYLNQLAWARTWLTVEQLTQAFKQIEQEMGRTPELRKQYVVTIDLDLLEHDGLRYHLADWNRPYVTELLDGQRFA